MPDAVGAELRPAHKIAQDDAEESMPRHRRDHSKHPHRLPILQDIYDIFHGGESATDHPTIDNSIKGFVKLPFIKNKRLQKQKFAQLLRKSHPEERIKDSLRPEERGMFILQGLYA